MNTLANHDRPVFTERALAQVLAHRYGDGTVYRPRETPRVYFDACRQLGLISADGFVTRLGYALAARYGT